MVTSEVEPIKHEQVPRNRFHSDKFYKCEFGRQKDASISREAAKCYTIFSKIKHVLYTFHIRFRRDELPVKWFYSYF
jgi:hypothetical protein